MTTKDYIQILIEDRGLESIFDLLNVTPSEALLALDEIGFIDLERLKAYYDEDE
jgi:hypothetical protein